MGGDLIAAQYGAYVAYAEILDLTGDPNRAVYFRNQAAQLQALYEREWWDESRRRFASFRYHDGSFATGYPGITNFFPLYFDLVGDPHKVQAALEEAVLSRTLLNVEERSYLPSIFFRYGRQALAYAEMLAQMDAAYARREYPEVSFAFVGATAAGLMGMTPDAPTRTLTTCNGLVEQTEWVELSQVPVFDNRVGVRHTWPATTTLINLSGPPLRWRAAFAGHVEEISINGIRHRPNHGTDDQGQMRSWVELTLGVQAEHTATVR